MFDVYVVGSTLPGEQGIDQLAEAMSGRYGVALEDLRARLGRGRFRVKANVDRATAEAYAKDLAAIGGRCSIEAASNAPNQSIPPPIAVPLQARTTTTPPAGVYQSGLSAAFSDNTIPAADLGALGRTDGLSLASLDGHDGHAGAKMPPSATFSPPLAAPAQRGGAPAAPAKPARIPDVPVELDPFRPPDAGDDELRVEIAPDELEHRARRRVSTPPATAIPTPTTTGRTSSPSMQPPNRRSQPSIPPRNTPEPIAIVRPPGRLGVLGDERVRFGLGLVIAIVLGFVPAHVIASIREHAAYHEVDALVEQRQIDATAQEDYDALDAFRAKQLEDKRAAHHSIAIMAFVIWGLTAGGISFVWFRQLPWDRWDSPRV